MERNGELLRSTSASWPRVGGGEAYREAVETSNWDQGTCSKKVKQCGPPNHT